MHDWAPAQSAFVRQIRRQVRGAFCANESASQKPRSAAPSSAQKATMFVAHAAPMPTAADTGGFGAHTAFASCDWQRSLAGHCPLGPKKSQRLPHT